MSFIVSLRAIPYRSSHYYQSWSSYYKLVCLFIGYVDFKNVNIFLLRPTVLALARKCDFYELMAEALAVPSVVIVLSRFQPFRAETVSISNTTYIAKRNILIQTKLTFFQNHFTASGSPVDFILPNFSLFVKFNRVNLWYFSIFFCFYFSDSSSMFKKTCMASFESLQGSDWPLFNKRFTVTVGCT